MVASSPTDRVLEALRACGQDVKRGRRPGHYDADCPLCPGDTGHHLSVDSGADGRALLKCWKGHAFADIMARLGLREADGFAEQTDGKPAPFTLAEFCLRKGLGIALAKEEGFSDGTDPYGRPCLVKTYTCEDGSQLQRFRLGWNRFSWPKTEPPEAPGPKARGATLGRGHLAAAEADGFVIAVEGGSDYLTLRQAGFDAYGYPASSMVDPEIAGHDFARMGRVYVSNERDNGAAEFLRSFAKAPGLSGRLWAVTWEPYKDPSEAYLADPDGFPDFVQARMAAACPLPEALAALEVKTVAPANGKAAASGDRGLVVRAIEPPATMADLRDAIAPVTWAWPKWLPQGLLTMLVAASGAGKSFLMLHLALCLIEGRDWPDDSPLTGEPGKALWVETEAAQGLNLGRVDAMGIPADAILYPFADPLESAILTDAKHQAQIEAVAARDEVRAIFLDSLSGGNTLDENSAKMMSTAIWLAELARDLGKPVCAAHHLRKRSERDNPLFGVTLDMVRGSSAIVQPARVIWALDVPGGPGSDIRRLSQIKNSLMGFPEPLGMALSDGGCQFGPAPEEPQVETALGDAKGFLVRLLDGEPLPAPQVMAEAKAAGVSESTLKRAKAVLKVRSVKLGGRWVWALPTPEWRDVEE